MELGELGPPGICGCCKESQKHTCRYPGQPRAACNWVEPGKRLTILLAAILGRRVPEVPDPGCSWPHLCHLDHVGELGEAGDGDDVMVGPTLGPGRRKQRR